MKAVILASGEGSNAENIVSFFQNKKECLEVLGIISDKAGSGVLEKAKGWDIPTALIEKSAMKSKSDLLFNLIFKNKIAGAIKIVIIIKLKANKPIMLSI